MSTQLGNDAASAPDTRSGRTAAPPMARRAVVSGTVGSALEWFDFAIYGTLSATVFPALFFSDLNPATGILASFATFGVGFFARPLGGLAFGALGDKLGRRRILMITLLFMGVSSALIGFLPGYGTIGLAAPLVLVVLRFVQGFALGGEATGAQLMTMEHAPADRRGFYGALIAVGSPISQVFATLVLTGLAAGLSEQAFTSWGWRVPFVSSFLLIAVGAYIRAKVEETPAFQEDVERVAEQPTADRPRALAVFKAYPGTVVRMIFSWAAPASVFYISVVFSVSYMTKTLGFSNDVSFGLLLAANAISVFAGILGGRVSDRIGRRNTMLIGLVALTVFLIPLFPALDSKNLVLIVLVIAGGLSAVQFMAGVQPAFFAEAFPTAVRYTGSAAGYTGANLLFSATAPFVASWLLGVFEGNTLAVTAYGLLIAASSFVALLLSPKVSPHRIMSSSHEEA